MAKLGAADVRPLTRNERVRATVAYWLIVVVCVAFSAAGWFLVYAQAQPSRGVQPVPAKIEHVEVVSTKDAHGHPTKRPLVIYSYTVGGVRYTTDRISSLVRPHGASWADEMVHRYHPGESVTAYVAPFDPGSAFLIRDRDWRTYAFGIVPLVLAVGLAAYWPWTGLRATKQT